MPDDPAAPTPTTSTPTRSSSSPVALAAPAAILWDMDGTLVDTEPYWVEAELALAAEYGGTWTREDAASLIGNALPDSAAILQEQAGIDLPADDIISYMTNYVVEAVRIEVPWCPGVRDLLAQARAASVPCALVTMSYAVLAEAVLGSLPDGTFRTMVTGDQVREGKPHPGPYLEAARRLGVDAAHCVAIEDSLTGVRSASAAGAYVVGVQHLVPIPPEAAQRVVPSLANVSWPDLCRWWLAAS